MSLPAAESTKKSGRKRLFLGLALLSLLVIAAASVLVWWVLTRPSALLNKVIMVGLAVVLVLVLLVFLLGLTALVWSIWRSRSLPSLQNVMYKAINGLYPLALQLGRWLGLEQDWIKNSYIQVSNQLVRVRLKGQVLQRVLILAPHCLQESECPYKVTVSPENCRRCGKCLIPILRDLAEKYQADLRLVSGGTSARKILKETRPQGVVAIACERDLTSGIQDSMGLPVLGIVNERPEGPCHNTRVDLAKVEEALKFMRKGE